MNHVMLKRLFTLFSGFLVVGTFFITGCDKVKTREIQNVSYDPTRELYENYKEMFIKHWKESTGEDVEVSAAHGGSGDQAKKVIEGMEADVVTLALAYDVNVIHEQANLMPANWQSRLPNNSCPYTSTIVFLVRKGNPKHIKDWDDLLREDVSIITPNPKTSGGARWNYLAAWGYKLRSELGGNFNMLKDTDPESVAKVAAANEEARKFVLQLHKRVQEMPKGARGATKMFVNNGMGDVLLAWENEALLTTVKHGNKDVEIVAPSLSMIAEPPVALIDSVVDKKGTRDLAEGYLKHLYSEEAQELVAQNYYRPSNPEILKKYADLFVPIELFSIDEVFGGWGKAQKEHFSEGGIFDQMRSEMGK